MNVRDSLKWGAAAFATSLPSVLRASEADIKIPDLTHVHFDGLGGISGETLMYLGIVICVIGAAFGLVQYVQTKALQVHKSMADVSHMIWESFRRRSPTDQNGVKRFLRHIGCAVRTFDRTIEERSKLHAENRQTDFRNYNDTNPGNQRKTTTTK